MEPEHALASLDRRLWAEAKRFQSEGKDSGDPFRGLWIDDADANGLLATLIDQQPRASPLEAVAPRFNSLVRLFQLTEPEACLLVAAVAPDLDVRYERLFAYLQDDVMRRRATVDLAIRLFGDLHEATGARILLTVNAPLRRAGLITIRKVDDEPASSLLARGLESDERIVDYLLGSDEIDERLRGVAAVDPSAAPGGLPDALARRLDGLAASLANRPDRSIVVFAGAAGSGKRRAASYLAACAGLRQLTVDTARFLRSDLPIADAVRLVLREATLQEASVYWAAADAIWSDDERATRLRYALADALAEWDVIVAMGLHESAPVPPILGTIPLLRLILPALSVQERLACWRSTLTGHPVAVDLGEALPDLAARFRLTAGQIVDAVGLARSHVPLDNGDEAPRDELTVSSLYAASRALSARLLTTLAQEVQFTVGWDAIVLPGDSLQQLHELCDTVRVRGKLLELWGLARTMPLGRGVTALFSGPPGTGKTLAASIVAFELGLPLYRIDLAGIVSKWIGETPKNIDQIFRMAEGSNAILLFNEAEALFGKRSEVRDSHDRYANIEISYLLEKMELYEGVAILATNMRQQMDEAFVRRLTFQVGFPAPDAADRERIWKTVWPHELPRSPDVDFDRLAQFKFTGGNIKNVVLAAASRAATEGGPVTMAHLLRGVTREYQKVGKQMTPTELNGHAGRTVYAEQST